MIYMHIYIYTPLQIVEVGVDGTVEQVDEYVLARRCY